MAGIKFYICDSETTGLDGKKHEVNEISIIRCDDRVQLTEFIKCDYPERASFDSLRITQKTIADLSKGKTKEEVISKVDQFLNEDGNTPAGRCFICHNAAFDRKFIHALYDKLNKTCPVDLWLCTLAMTKFYIKQTGQKSLANLHAACEFVGVKMLSGAHNSKVDTRNTFLLYKNLIDDKQIDYLPFIKSFPHIVNSSLDGDGLDPDLLDL